MVVDSFRDEGGEIGTMGLGRFSGSVVGGHRKGVSSSLAALAFIIVLIAGLVVAGLMLARWRVAEQHYEERGERLVSMAREVVKMRIRYVTEDSGNQTIVRPIIYLKSGWMGESKLTHLLVIDKSGSIIVDADVDIRVAPMETLRLKPSDLHPSLAKYDSDYEALQSEVKLIVLHTSLGNIVSAAPPTGGYEIINVGPTETLTETKTQIQTTTETVNQTIILSKSTDTFSRCAKWTTKKKRTCKSTCIDWTTGKSTTTKETRVRIQYTGICFGEDYPDIIACEVPCEYDYCVLYAELGGTTRSKKVNVHKGQVCGCAAKVGPFFCYPHAMTPRAWGKAVKEEVLTTKICTRWSRITCWTRTTKYCISTTTWYSTYTYTIGTLNWTVVEKPVIYLCPCEPATPIWARPRTLISLGATGIPVMAALILLRKARARMGVRKVA